MTKLDMKAKENQWDVAVIGGGPAGMMAAGTAASYGARVILLEKNSQLGCKLLITGSGRCNLTNAELDRQRFLDHYGKKGKYFHSVFNNFGVAATLDFFRSLGLALIVEKDNQNKVFPASNQATDVLKCLIGFMKKNRVLIQTKAAVKKICLQSGQIEKIELPQTSISAKNYILCTGGLSFPATGSTGEGISMAKELGHTIVTPQPALVPLILKEHWISELEGVSLENVTIGLFKNDRKITAKSGDAVFTAHGISGPVIFNLSRVMNDVLPGNLSLAIDFLPQFNDHTFPEELQQMILTHHHKLVKNLLDMWLPKSLVPLILRLSEIDPQKRNHMITRPERKKLIQLLKDFRLQISHPEGFSRAIVTAGGVSLDDIDLRTMRSRKIDNLFFAGEMIDIDGPTGGYNLQMCWSTGHTAGIHSLPKTFSPKAD